MSYQTDLLNESAVSFLRSRIEYKYLHVKTTFKLHRMKTERIIIIIIIIIKRKVQNEMRY